MSGQTSRDKYVEYLKNDLGLTEEDKTTALRLYDEQNACKCDLRTKLVGDGCAVCNPKLAAKFAKEPA